MRQCVNVSKISDVPPANALVVDPKALNKQEQALEVEYWEEVKQMQLRDVECCEWVAKVKSGVEVSKDGGEFELDDAGVLHLRDKQGSLRLVIPPIAPAYFFFPGAKCSKPIRNKGSFVPPRHFLPFTPPQAIANPPIPRS